MKTTLEENTKEIEEKIIEEFQDKDHIITNDGKLYVEIDAHWLHQQLQKAREDMLHTLDSSINNVTYAPKKPSDYKAWQDGFMEAYQQARKIIYHSDPDQNTTK